MGHVSRSLCVSALAAVLCFTTLAMADYRDNDYPNCGLEVHVYPDGATYLVNPTDAIICFSGYDIQDAGSKYDGLTSIMDTSSWVSIESQIDAGGLSSELTLIADSTAPAGADLNFDAITNNVNFVAELNGSAVAEFQANSSIYIGDIFTSMPTIDRVVPVFAIYADGDWYVGGTGEAVVTGQSAYNTAALVLVPEPASLAMLVVGAMAAIRRRRSA